ncbi:MAG: HTH-type transcriptional activator IlvY [Desulfobulbaceae bacterium]|nr:HTH-type transcriptional activator IlvY [Desulfobulbaceae bacterium]HIJ79075.1 HTH-type transcriptional activator IlvY [Deltaproteobacteria bacterium]
MDIHVLKLYKHLAASLHFGRTSRACNITPSALTRAVQRLEAELGERLLVRDNRSVGLTPAGELFRKYADDVLLRWDELQNDLARDDELRGEISLYCSVTAVFSILPGILSRFRKDYPRVHINLSTGDAARALTKLFNNEADLTIAALPEKLPPQLEFMKTIETPLVFIAPVDFKDTVVYSGKEIDWRQTPIVMAEQGLSRERIERWFRENNILPKIYAQVAGNEAIIAMVSLGCGVGIVPKLVLDKSPLKAKVEILAQAPQLTPFTIGVCTVKKNMSNPKIKAFWEVALREGRW